MKVQAGKKMGKQTSGRTSIGQTSAPARTKNGLNGSSIHARFRKKGFYSAYTLIVAITYVVVVFSITVQGLTIGKLAERVQKEI